MDERRPTRNLRDLPVEVESRNVTTGGVTKRLCQNVYNGNISSISNLSSQQDLKDPAQPPRTGQHRQFIALETVKNGIVFGSHRLSSVDAI